MNISVVLHALRVGSSIQNPTPFKWAGLAVTLALALLPLAQSRGWLIGVSDEDLSALVLAALALLAQIVTTDKIGLLPARQSLAPIVRNDQPMPPRDYAPPGVPGPRDPAHDADEFGRHDCGPFDEH